MANQAPRKDIRTYPMNNSDEIDLLYQISSALNEALDAAKIEQDLFRA